MTKPFKVGDLIKRVDGQRTIYKGEVTRVETDFLHVRITEGDDINRLGLTVYPYRWNCVLLRREQSPYSTLLKKEGSR